VRHIFLQNLTNDIFGGNLAVPLKRTNVRKVKLVFEKPAWHAFKSQNCVCQCLEAKNLAKVPKSIAWQGNPAFLEKF